MNHSLITENSANTSIWSVSSLCLAVRRQLENGFGLIKVQGEISGFSSASSGHCYFLLKDSNAQLKCAMFRKAASQLTQLPANGDKVQVEARIGLYDARGELQLIVEKLSAQGQGDLFEQFLKLKEKLTYEGLFAAERKRDLPNRPKPSCIGIVTSLKAAALHDVLSTLKRRAPYAKIVISPASVQGIDAPAELISALKNLYAYVPSVHLTHPIDAILLVRGGGSMEDLWAFNDENLARCMAQSPVPLICGVGHETDFTIADFVADVRAPTPTAAAEMVAAPVSELEDQLAFYIQHGRNAMQNAMNRWQQQLDNAYYALSKPAKTLNEYRARLQTHEHQLSQALNRTLQRRTSNLQLVEQRLNQTLKPNLKQKQHDVDHLEARLSSLSPARVLERGYTWLEDAQTKKPITSAANLSPKKELTAYFSDGKAALYSK